MTKSEGATPGAILSATPGATPRQLPVNGGATHTPNTPSVAPALGGWVHAVLGIQEKAISKFFGNGIQIVRADCVKHALCPNQELALEIDT